jgi:hypothetical protein
MTRTSRTNARRVTWLAAALALQAIVSPGSRDAVAAPRPDQIASLERQYAAPMPASVRFEANLGQVEDDARFVARFGNATVLLTPRTAVMRLVEPAPRRDPREPQAMRPPDLDDVRAPRRQATVTMRLAGANPEPEVIGVQMLEGRSHYYRGSNPALWVRDVPAYARVCYDEVYPGVDMVFYGNGGDRDAGRLEYDFVVAPGADPNAIELAFEGAEQVEIDEAGGLAIETAIGTIRQVAPVVYQEAEDGRREVASRYVPLGGGRVGFELAGYDHAAPLVIDPVVAFSLDATIPAELYNVGAADPLGNYYAAGWFYDPPLIGIRIRKLSPSGSLVYETTIKGAFPTDIAADAAGNVHVTGNSISSAEFPTTASAVQPVAGSLYDAVLLKLSPNGSSLLYSTFLGGSDHEDAASIALDSSNNACVAGYTRSTDFPVRDAVQSSLASPGKMDAFVAKIDPSGSSFVFSTYLGGAGDDRAGDIAVDLAGAMYIIGKTHSPNFPVRNPIKGTLAPNDSDMFVAKLDAAGSPLVYSTFLGGSDLDSEGDIAVDTSGNAYVTGFTYSTDYPVQGAFQTTHAGGLDCVVSKLNSAGSGFIYSTYLGGTHNDYGSALGVAPTGEVYVVGQTASADFPVSNQIPGMSPPGSGSSPAFITKLGATGSALVYSSSFGPGYLSDVIAVSGSGSVDVFQIWPERIVRIMDTGAADLQLTMTATPNPVQRGKNLTYRLTVTNLGPDTVAARVTMATPQFTTFVSVSGSQGSLDVGPAPGGTGTVYFDLGILAPNATATVTIVLKRNPHGTNPVRGEATVTGTLFDPNLSNNAAVRTTNTT